jgi:hypothetical protein
MSPSKKNNDKKAFLGKEKPFKRVAWIWLGYNSGLFGAREEILHFILVNHYFFVRVLTRFRIFYTLNNFNKVFS